MNNENRASAALAAVEAFRNVHNGSPLDTTDGMQEAIGDLVGNLCHLAARHEIPPFAMLELGATYYAAETVDDNGDFLEVFVTLDVLARPNGSDEDYQTFDDLLAAIWRAQAQNVDVFDGMPGGRKVTDEIREDFRQIHQLWTRLTPAERKMHLTLLRMVSATTSKRRRR